jgi:hypothetical protein
MPPRRGVASDWEIAVFSIIVTWAIVKNALRPYYRARRAEMS